VSRLNLCNRSGAQRPSGRVQLHARVAEDVSGSHPQLARHVRNAQALPESGENTAATTFGNGPWFALDFGRAVSISTYIHISIPPRPPSSLHASLTNQWVLPVGGAFSVNAHSTASAAFAPSIIRPTASDKPSCPSANTTFGGIQPAVVADPSPWTQPASWRLRYFTLVSASPQLAVAIGRTDPRSRRTPRTCVRTRATLRRWTTSRVPSGRAETNMKSNSLSRVEVGHPSLDPPPRPQNIVMGSANSARCSPCSGGQHTLRRVHTRSRAIDRDMGFFVLGDGRRSRFIDFRNDQLSIPCWEMSVSRCVKGRDAIHHQQSPVVRQSRPVAGQMTLCRCSLGSAPRRCTNTLVPWTPRTHTSSSSVVAMLAFYAPNLLHVDFRPRFMRPRLSTPRPVQQMSV
jgi:hypothetical protein